VKPQVTLHLRVVNEDAPLGDGEERHAEFRQGSDESLPDFMARVSVVTEFYLRSLAA